MGQSIEVQLSQGNPILVEVGAAGPQGAGVPSGGASDQFLKKTSGADFDTAWQTISKTTIGLGNVDNTSDAAKPVSTATQSALATKIDLDATLVDLRGITGDGTTALQSAFNLAATPGTLIRVLLPAQLNLTSACQSLATGYSAQIRLPQVTGAAQTTPMSFVELVGLGHGDGVPPTWTDTNESAVSPAGSVIRSTGIGPLASTSGSVFGVAGFSRFMLITRDVTLRLDDDPQLGGFALGQLAGFRAFGGLRVDTPVTAASTISQPTHSTRAIDLPSVNNLGTVIADEMYVQGFNQGVAIAEHADIRNLAIFKCNTGLVVKQSYHGARIGYSSIEWCPTMIAPDTTVGGTPYPPVDFGLIDFEETDQPSRWYTTTYTINDPSNVLLGRMNWIRVQAGNGRLKTLLLNGAENLKLNALSTGGQGAINLTRTVPTTVDDTVELGTFVFTNGTGVIDVSVVVASTSFGVAKQYHIAASYAMAATYKSVDPVLNSGAYSGNDFALEVLEVANSCTLRLRRTAGSTAGVAYVGLAQSGVLSDAFTPSTTTGHSTAPTSSLTASMGPDGTGRTTLTRTLPVTVNDTVEIGNFSFTNGAAALDFSVVASAVGFGVSKEYRVAVYYGMASSWKTITPASDSGPYSGNDISVEVYMPASICYLRVRRTAGTTAATAYITLIQQGIVADPFTSASATGSSSAPTASITTSSDPTKVSKTGDTMTGDLVLSGALVRLAKGQSYRWVDSNDEIRLEDNPAWLSSKQNVMTFKTYGAVNATGAFAWLESSSSALLMSLDAKTGALTNNGDYKLATAGNGLYVKEGTNATMGLATLGGGTVVVNTTKVTANSRIQLTAQALGTVTTPSALCVSARTAGTSFTILASQATDTSTVAWQIIEPA